MSTAINQKAYLQKYLAGPSGEKKKKKKKVAKGKGFKIIDDDIDLSKLRPLEGDELDVLGEGEDAPQIAGIIDERPEEIRKLEQFQSNTKWRVVNQDDGFNSKLQIEEITRNVKEVEKDNELIFGKMYSDSEDERKNNSDLSPQRKQPVSNKTRSSSKKPQNNSDSDFSPPRRNREPSPKRFENNRSNPLPHTNENHKAKDRIKKPSRWSEPEPIESNSKRKSPSLSRKSKKQRSQSPERQSKRKSSDSDISPPRKSQKVKHRSFEHEPPSNSNKDSSKKRSRSPDSGLSPRKKKWSADESHKKSRNESDSDQSPRRRTEKRHKSPSPQRKSRKLYQEKNSNKRKHDSDSDLSPPRKERHKSSRETVKRSDSSPSFNKRMAKTLDGKMAGLQDARQLRQENNTVKRREDEAFNKMTDDVSGRNAQVVSRKGKRQTSEERRQEKEKVDKQKELEEKYKKWNKGVKQAEAQETRVAEFLHEASKPLARHKDDRDLEARLKDVERDGDPMLRYIKEKKRERGELPPEKPSYKGSFPPNRFNIRPGYRWDGVDRSNGYEKKYFTQQSKKKAQEEEAYKWSTEDL